jgi:hypothetical protein
VFAYASEDPAHPLEHLIDGIRGRGGTRWASTRPSATERIVLEFDHPQRKNAFQGRTFRSCFAVREELCMLLAFASCAALICVHQTS